MAVKHVEGDWGCRIIHNIAQAGNGSRCSVCLTHGWAFDPRWIGLQGLCPHAAAEVSNEVAPTVVTHAPLLPPQPDPMEDSVTSPRAELLSHSWEDTRLGRLRLFLAHLCARLQSLLLEG